MTPHAAEDDASRGHLAGFRGVGPSGTDAKQPFDVVEGQVSRGAAGDGACGAPVGGVNCAGRLR